MIKSVVAKLTFLIVIGYFSFKLILSPDPWIFIDYANLGIHEAGHLIFSPFGVVTSFLGGTIFQLLVPLLCLIHFIWKKSNYGISFCLFWIGDNIINVGRYIVDARSMQLPLFGGGIHDWNWLLGRWGLLHLDIQIGNFVHQLGVAVLAISMAYMVILILIEIFEYYVYKSG